MARRSGRAGRRSGWRSFGWAALAGVVVTTGVALLQRAGEFDPLKGYLTDVRMRHAQFFSPPISDEIVHIDLDDDSLRRVGRWPWHREKVAMALDVVREMGPRTIVLDILLDDPQEPRNPFVQGVLKRVEDDALLGEAIERAGNVLVGLSIARESEKGKGPERASLEESAGLEVRWPIAPIRDAVTGMGYVNVGQAETGVRALRMAADVDDLRLYQLGVVAAAHFMGAWPDGVSATPRELRVGERVVPLEDWHALIPWRPRPEAQATAWVEGEASAWNRIHRRLPLHTFVEIGQIRKELRLGLGILTRGEPLDHEATMEDLEEAEDAAAFAMQSFGEKSIEEVLREARESYEREPTPDKGAELDYLEALAALGSFREHLEGMPRRLLQLRNLLSGKLVLVGWTGTGALADFYPTAMGVKTPGVSVHGAIANGLLTGHWIDRAPAWLDLLVTVVAGLSATLVATGLSPSRGWIVAMGLTAMYAAFNTVVVFDYLDVRLALGAPLVAAVGSWATCTTIRAIQERREKAAIRRQFRARVSAQLVDYLSEHPDLVNMEGEERELTIAFTDFAGFTSISEKLEGRQTVAMLNRYLRAMTEVMLDRSGYVNKFLGDGIMGFWGAPAVDPEHAAKACFAVLECYDALDMLNAAPEYEELPKLGMRVGISTGKVIVGDCGAPPRLNDYTVIGDAVNLAARLESANKMLGTRALVTARTRELMSEEGRGRILWRPMGRIRVVGQTNPVEILELVARRDDPDVTDEMREWIEQTGEAVKLFERGALAESLEIWQELVLFDRGQAGALLYTERCTELLESGREDFFLPLRSK